jgi:hypothetical protein
MKIKLKIKTFNIFTSSFRFELLSGGKFGSLKFVLK